MIVRFKQVKDKHEFITKLEKANNKVNVIIRDITIMDSDVQLTISTRDDNISHVNIPIEYKNIKKEIINKDKI